jgi:23S rRNA (guanosine2251-2'-O)-methyltransferase
VIGAEGAGLSRLVKENCDWLVNIPMAKGNESLNASVAASIVLQDMFRARN